MNVIELPSCEAEAKVGASLWKLFMDNGYRVPQNVCMEGWEIKALQAEEARRLSESPTNQRKRPHLNDVYEIGDLGLQEHMPQLYPLGVTPEGIWKDLRIQDLKRAITAYTEAGLPVDPVWIEEYNRRVQEYNDRRPS